MGCARMTLDLDKLEQVAKAAQASFRESNQPDWYNGGWSEASVTPAEVLALVARARELERRARHVEPVYLAAKALHQLTDHLDDDWADEMPLALRLAEALDDSYGEL